MYVYACGYGGVDDLHTQEPSNSRSHYVCYYINAHQIWNGIAYSSGLEFELEIQIPFVTAMA